MKLFYGWVGFFVGIIATLIIVIIFPTIHIVTNWEIQYVDRWHQPEIVTVPEYIVTEKVTVVTKEVKKEVWPSEYRYFQSYTQFKKWASRRVIMYREAWICVDYALEFQRRAYMEGYIVSTEILTEDKPKSHMVNSIIIGKDIWFYDAQIGKLWKAARRDE